MSSETPNSLVWCYEILNNGVKYLVDEFRTKLKGQITEGSTFEIFSDPVNKKKIRYSDVKCNDNNRVKLLHNNNSSTDFIHANYIATPFSENRFIAAQGPLEKTKKDFWRMVLENNVEVIVMLCNIVENNETKCELYFPYIPGDITSFGEIFVKCLEVSPISKSHLTVTRTMLEVTVVDGASETSKVVAQYRWTEWPDKSVPRTIEPLIIILDAIRHHTTPIVVHCSAGIGRTGCFIAIEHYIERIILEEKFDQSTEYVKFLRTMRQHAIQTDKQFVFIHYCILKIIIGDLKHVMPDDIKYLYDKFEKEYEEFI
uniref:Tyrosine-protein phosphatase domain-containing protein n=1 Tax=Parastrongyloides trichosuri TaxID=131310 RepID=A0A0N5A198_PARTI